MLKKLLPVLLALIGVGAGVGAGVALKPPPEEVVEIHPCGPDETGEHKDEHADDTGHDAEEDEENAEFDYVKLNNQFIVPVVHDGVVASLVVLSLNIEVKAGQTDAIYQREPRLRDALLQVMFDHANAGGFDGAFTGTNSMILLRSALKETARKVGGPSLSDVLIHDIVRQDI